MTARMDAPLLIEDRDRVRLITWNRPDALNAMSLELWDGTRDAIRTARDADANCIVLTGTGRAFTVGQDLGEMMDPRHADESRGFRGVMTAIIENELPMVAAVNGLAVGFGTTVLPWCDLVVISTEARFRAPFVGLGVTTEAAGSVSLPSTMGAQAAAHFVLTGDWL
jgi:enoyl-CoA hydratase/carnithine racemase